MMVLVVNGGDSIPINKLDCRCPDDVPQVLRKQQALSLKSLHGSWLSVSSIYIYIHNYIYIYVYLCPTNHVYIQNIYIYIEYRIFTSISIFNIQCLNLHLHLYPYRISNIYASISISTSISYPYIYICVYTYPYLHLCVYPYPGPNSEDSSAPEVELFVTDGTVVFEDADYSCRAACWQDAGHPETAHYKSAHKKT